MTTPLQSLPGWLVDATLQGTLAILVVWLIVPWARRGLGAQAAYILWGLVLLRLLLPWQPASPFHWGISLPEVRGMDQSELQITVTTGEEDALFVPTGQPVKVEPVRLPVALIGWLAGVVVVAGFSTVRSLRASRLARRAREVSGDPRLVEILRSLPLAGVQIRETGELRSPALTGLWQPVVLLPLDWRERINDEQLRCVLAHEAGHHCRRDLLWRWIFLVARALHWFNPLVWLAERAARTDQEMACDEWVLRHDHAASAERYGEALLLSAQRLDGRGFRFSVQADMAESRVGLRRRIVHLARIRPRGWRALAAGVLLAGLLLMATTPMRSDPVAVETPEATPPPEAPKTTEPAKEEKPTANPVTKGPNVLIEVKILEIPPKLVSDNLAAGQGQNGTIQMRAIYNSAEFQQFLQGISKQEEVELMSAPSVTTRSGQRATIQIVREFRYPTEFSQAKDDPAKSGVRIPPTPTAFETKPTGVTLECEPTVRKDGTIDLMISSRVVEFEGFVDFGGSRAAKSDLQKDPLVDTYQPAEEGGTIKQPIFASREMSNKIAMRSGETVALGGITSDFRKVMDSLDASSAKEPAVKRVLFILMTATSIRADGQKREASQAVAAPARNGEQFYAVPAPNKPGYVTSPYAPEAGYIDVRGLEEGTEVKDPYTGQMFLVPAAKGAEPDPKRPFAKAAQIMIPLVDLKDATVIEALDLLKNKGVENDPEPDPARKGVNLVLKIAPPERSDESARMTLTLQNVSLLDAIKHVATLAGLTVHDERYAVSLVPATPPVMSTRVYRVPRAFLPDLQKADSQAVLEYWKARGISFPEGATVSFFAPARLVLRNTMDEHSKLGALFMAQQDVDGVRPRVVAASAEFPPDKLPQPTLTPQASKEKPEYKISQVETRKTEKGGRIVTETITHLAKTPVVSGDVKIACYFYERTKLGEVRLVGTSLAPKWLSSPVDWKDSASEELELRYEPGSDESTYEGCVLAIYKRGVLEDVWSSSEDLRKKTPLEPMM